MATIPKATSASALAFPDHYFSKELAGENPPSLAALRQLYDLASQLFAQKPWNLLADSQLVLVRNSANNELCYCSVMGALGQVYAMHAYIGPESFRMFRKMQDGEITVAQEFFASQRSVFVESVTRGELEKPDRELLEALGHPKGRATRCPIFRAIRPGFYPWFVTSEEAQVLAECIRAVSVVCSLLAAGSGNDLWDESREIYPLVSRVPSQNSDYRIEPTKVDLISAPTVFPVQVKEETLRQLRNHNPAVGGVMELDYIFTRASIGGKNERRAFTCAAMAVDAETGIIFASEVTSSGTPAADAMARAFIKAVQSTGVLPKEVRVRQAGYRDALLPLLQLIHVAVRVKQRLPAMDEASAALSAFLA